MKQALKKEDNIPFTQVANAVLNDKDISFKAKGLFSYIYSKPNGWDFAAARICNDSTDGVRAVEEGLKELVAAGYLNRRRLQSGAVEYEISWEKDISPTAKIAVSQNRKQLKTLTAKKADISNKDYLSNKEEEINKETAPQSDAVKVDSFFNAVKRKERLDDSTPMPLSEFVLMCRGAQYRHIRLIGEYADERKLSFSTRGQWREFGRRNMRSARQLVPYTDRQIAKAMEKMERDMKEKGGFLSKWTLETLTKYLDET